MTSDLALTTYLLALLGSLFILWIHSWWKLGKISQIRLTKIWFCEFCAHQFVAEHGEMARCPECDSWTKSVK